MAKTHEFDVIKKLHLIKCWSLLNSYVKEIEGGRYVSFKKIAILEIELVLVIQNVT